MKYLLHSSKATYDATTKKWIFDLDQRIHNPTQLRLAKATFTTAGDTSVNPSVVYMRSDALARMISKKHTVELQDANHPNNSNVIATLTETHTRGRYRIIGGQTFPINPNQSERKIDIYFTDGDTILEGEVGSGGGIVDASDSDIEDIGSELLAWFDMAPARVLDVAYATAENAGDPVSYLYNRSPGPQTLTYVSQYGNEFQLANVGSSVGITRNGSWQSLADSSTPTGALDEIFTVHSLFVTPPVLGTFSYLFDIFMLKLFTWTGGALGYKDNSGNNATINVSLIPGRAYLLTVERRAATQDYNGNGLIEGYEFYFTVEDLVTDVVVNDTVVQGNNHPGTEQVWRLGSASTHFTHVQGPFIIHNGNNATHIANSQEWLRKKFTGESTSESSETTVSEDATFFAELDINVS